VVLKIPGTVRLLVPVCYLSIALPTDKIEQSVHLCLPTGTTKNEKYDS
jgi:hypothetical protein